MLKRQWFRWWSIMILSVKIHRYLLVATSPIRRLNSLLIINFTWTYRQQRIIISFAIMPFRILFRRIITTILPPRALLWWSVGLNYDLFCNFFTTTLSTDNAINKYGPSNGLILLFDMKNFRFGHLTRNNLRSLRAFFAYMQEGLPTAIEKIHIFNTFPSFNLVMKLISPLMNADLVKKVKLLTFFQLNSIKIL